MKINSCHDWLVDSNLLLKELAQSNDVSSSVKVGVNSLSAIVTGIPNTFTISFSDLSASTTSLTGIFGIDVLDSFSQSVSFVGEELLELHIAPVTQELIESPSILFFTLNVQLFENEELSIASSYLLTDTVVHISNKPIFSSTESFKMPLCGTSAFTLQLRFKPLIFTFDSTKFSAVKKLSIVCDDWVNDSSVNTDCFSDGELVGVISFGNKIEYNFTILDAEGCPCNSPRDIWFKVGRDCNWKLDTTKQRGQSYNTFVKVEMESSQIVSDGRELFFDGENFELFSLEHITGLVTSSTNKTTCKIGKPLTSFLISGMVELELVESPQLVTSFHNEVTGFVVGDNCLGNTLVVGQDQFNSSFHLYSLVSNTKYKNSLKGNIAIPLTAKAGEFPCNMIL